MAGAFGTGRVMGPWLPAFPRRSSRFAPFAPQSRPGGPMTDLHVVDANAGHVDQIVAVIHHAFSARRGVGPPAAALFGNARDGSAAFLGRGGRVGAIGS